MIETGFTYLIYMLAKVEVTVKDNTKSAVTLPLSMLSTISLCILRRPVSVEWNRLYADCRSLI